jgi:hypothetical protein
MSEYDTKVTAHVDEDGPFVRFHCPYCRVYLDVYNEHIACKIFRHGIYKNNFQLINSHLPKEECDRLVASGLIFGCAGPFMLVPDPASPAQYKVAKCGYI